jgi:hypothetical protein
VSIDPYARFSPYGSTGSLINMIFCPVLIVGGVIIGIAQQHPMGFLVAVIGTFIEIQFVRIYLKARERARQQQDAHD